MPLRLLLELDDRWLHFPLADGERIVGSAAECDVRVPHYSVSRRHARLRIEGGCVEVEDLASRNGTRIDGVRLGAPQVLRPDQELLVGSVRGRVEEVDPAELEVAVLFPGGVTRAEGFEPGHLAAETLSLGNLHGFALRRLPGILRRLAGGEGRLAVAQELGAAVFESLPCVRIAILDQTAAGSEGVLFLAERGTEPADRQEAFVAGPLLLRLDFPAAVEPNRYREFLGAAALLLDLAARPAGAVPAGGDEPAEILPPPLPSPATLDPRMAKVYADAARVARGEVSVLLLGESGTGKELLARYIHAASPRRLGPFVAVNCAALPRDLLEAELFGIEKGAATGVSARPGKFEQAHGGTLFLDEIGDMAPETQAKILRVLQEGEVFRVGGREPRGADGRLISATNRPVDGLLAAGHFRGDLYHRIADWRVELPPLRDRRSDIANLAAYFLDRESTRLGRPARGISRAALDLLLACPWPGNVRQLEREMARAALFLDRGELLETRHLQVTGLAPAPTAGRNLRALLMDTERTEIERVLSECRGDAASAARRLGLARSTLYRRLKELGVALPQAD